MITSDERSRAHCFESDRRGARVSQPAPTRRRQRSREFATALFAIAVAFFLGDQILRALSGPPFIMVAGIFVLLYVGCYILFWRLAEGFWK